MAVKTKAPKPLIKAASIATVLEKGTNKILGFLVKSNRNNDYYQITTEMIAGERVFFCDCEAKDWGYDECCHVKAIKEVLLAKAELEQAEAEAAIAETEKIVATQPMIAEQGETPAQVAQVAMTQAAEQHVQIIEFGQLVTSKRAPVFAAPTFVNPLANLPLNGNQAFSILK